MFADSGHIALGHRIYQEIYPENGRWYGTYKKGKYMFPIDEVRAALLSSACPLPCSDADLELRPSWRDSMYFTKSFSLRAMVFFTALQSTAWKVPGS